MSQNLSITIQQLSYSNSDEKQIFHDLDLILPARKIGLVGANGIGKSTLLKLITKEITPNSGNLSVAKVAYVPQDHSSYLYLSVASVLGIETKLAALQRINNGSIDIHDFDMVGEDWNLVETTKLLLQKFGCNKVDLNAMLRTLSGGEITKILLAKTFQADADWMILDEPTNNLDLRGRRLLYDAVQESTKAMLIVSHDRELLNLMEQIVELTPKDVKIYGGNYDFFVTQKQIANNAAEQQLANAKKQLRKTQQTIQTTKEKQQQKTAYGKTIRRSKSQAKVILDSMKERSGKTQKKLNVQQTRLAETVGNNMQQAKDAIEVSNEINIKLPKTFVPANKMILELEHVDFGYDTNNLIIKDFNLIIQGPERIAISGDNGSGKTTLLQLMAGKLNPQRGKINVGVQNISYLDQHASGLNPALTVLDNFRLMHPDVTENNVRYFLAQFLFRAQYALKLVKNLSGGEKLRALLACVLFAESPPQLLLLDEPTNHLDLASIASIESALQCYQGAIVVASHDTRFLEHINITRMICKY